jgi:hypothetical protein
MTSTAEIITASCAVLGALGVLGGGFVFATHFSNRLAFAERDSKEALDATKKHTTQIAVTTDHAETALKLGEKHTAALSDTGAKVAGMEAVYADIRKSLEQLPLLCEDVGEMKQSVAVLTSQMADIRPRRAASSKKRKR